MAANDNLKLEVQSALSCLEEALAALERAHYIAERHERLGEVSYTGTDVIERAANSARSAQRTLEAAAKARR